jgi:hypothetical protein
MLLLYDGVEGTYAYVLLVLLVLLNGYYYCYYYYKSYCYV